MSLEFGIAFPRNILGIVNHEILFCFAEFTNWKIKTIAKTNPIAIIIVFFIDFKERSRAVFSAFEIGHQVI